MTLKITEKPNSSHNEQQFGDRTEKTLAEPEYSRFTITIQAPCFLGAKPASKKNILNKSKVSQCHFQLTQKLWLAAANN